jgi:hypothetical protein
MNTVKLTKRGEFLVCDLSTGNRWRCMSPERFWRYSRDTVELHGATFGGLFRALSRLLPKDLMALGSMARCPVKDFMAEMAKPCREDMPFKGIALTPDVSLWGKDTSVYFRVNGVDAKDGSDTTWAIEFTPVNQLKKLPLSVRDGGIYEDFKLTKPITMQPSLLELIFSVLWEISFMGGPEMREKQRAELDRRVKDVESGKVKTFSFDELKRRLKDKKKKRSRK